MSLQNLTLEQLNEMADVVATLCRVGNDLVASGITPTFDLSPGQAVAIRLDAVMPQAASQHDDTPSPEAAQPEPAPAPEETPLAAGDTAGGAPIPSATEQSAPGLPETATPAASEPQDDPHPVALVAEGSGGGVAYGSGSTPPAAPAATPAPATHQDKLLPATWTDAEDARLIEIVVTRVRIGETKKAAIAKAASELGRPEAGTAFRAHHKLKARIDAALTAAAMEQAATEPLEDKPFPVQEGAAGEGATPPAAQTLAPVSFAADEVTSHLMALPEKGVFGGGWTVERDHELMELSIAGWQPNEIAVQLQVQTNAIKPRFDALTGLYEDATGKKIRRFTREAVFAALSRLAGKAA